MAFDPNILLGIKSPDFPNPLQYGIQGMTLANLASRQALEQAQVQGIQQYADATRAAAQGAPMDYIAQNYPLGYSKLLQDRKTLELTTAQRDKERMEAFKSANAVFGNAANDLLQQSGGNPVTLSPDQKMWFSQQALHAGQIAGLDPAQMNVPSVMDSDERWQTFLHIGAGSVTDPKTSWDIFKGRQELGPGIRKTLAEASEAEQKAQYEGMRARAASTEAGAAALRAQVAQQEYLHPAPVNGPQGAFQFNRDWRTGGVTGAPIMLSGGGAPTAPPATGPAGVGPPLPGGAPAPGVNQPPTGAAGVLAATPTGGPFAGMMGAMPPQGAQPQPQQPAPAQVMTELPPAYKTSKEQIDKAQFAAHSGQLMLQLLQEMQATDAKGVYSGGVWGTEGGKRLVSILGGLGYLSPAQTEKLMNTQVFDAQARNVVAQAVSAFAQARVAARELPFFEPTKPSTEQLAATRQQIFPLLWSRAQRDIAFAQQQSEYINSRNPQTGMFPMDVGGFVPDFSHLPRMPMVKPGGGGIDTGLGITVHP